MYCSTQRYTFCSKLCVFLLMCSPIVIFFQSVQVRASQRSCQNIQFSESVPLCPEGRTNILDERYPVVAAVVSDAKSDGDFAVKYVVDFVQKVLQSSPDSPPKILMPVTESTFDEVVANINRVQKDKVIRAKWLAALKRVNSDMIRWQQDYFEAFSDSQGKITVKQFDKYDRVLPSAVSKLVAASGICEVTQGDHLTSRSDEVSGMYGGNLEPLPSGLCAFGDDHFLHENHWKAYAKQICDGDESRILKVPTYWLAVGHSDEILKTIPDAAKSEPCNYSFAISSPDKALELLKANPEDRFIDKPKSALSEYANYNDFWVLNEICKAYLERKKIEYKYPSAEQPPAQLESAMPISRDIASQQTSALSPRPSPSPLQHLCQNLKNKDIYELFANSREYKDYTQLVQKEMNGLKANLTAKMKAKSPECGVDFIDVPQLFVFDGAKIVKPDRHDSSTWRLPKEFGRSVLPNPTNSFAINNTLIAPDPYNKSFRKYLTEEYAKRGQKAEYIDTFDYTHIQGGNVHCASHEIRGCRPRL